LEHIEGMAKPNQHGEHWYVSDALTEKLTSRLSVPQRTLYDTISHGERSGLLLTSRRQNQIIGLAINWSGITQWLDQNARDIRDASRHSRTSRDIRDVRRDIRDPSYISPEESKKSKNSPGANALPKSPQTTAATSAVRAESLPLPESLDTEPFLSAWTEWIAYRRERRLSVRDRTMCSQLEDLAKIGSSQAAKCLRLSIRNGWQGIFPEKCANHQTTGVNYDPNATDVGDI
jgi:hypothetical protein